MILVITKCVQERSLAHGKTAFLATVDVVLDARGLETDQLSRRIWPVMIELQGAIRGAAGHRSHHTACVHAQ
jgi:hypothetical protein